jgi:hypothetical protein
VPTASPPQYHEELRPFESDGGCLKEQLRAFEADHVWVSDNFRTLINQYSEQWIAVKNGQVIASDPDFSGLVAKLPDPSHTCVEFITGEPLEIIM